MQPGDKVLDLYGGVGLFTSQAIELVGESGRIDLVEGSKSATGDALRNFAEQTNVGVHTGDVEKILPRFSKADVIILDPPREGAGQRGKGLLGQQVLGDDEKRRGHGTECNVRV